MGIFISILFWLCFIVGIFIFCICWGNHVIYSKERDTRGWGNYKLFKREMEKREWDLAHGFMIIEIRNGSKWDNSYCRLDWWGGSFNFENKHMILKPISYFRAFFLIYLIARRCKKDSLYDWSKYGD